MKRIWNNVNNRLYLEYPSNEKESLEIGVYTIDVDEYGRFFLTRLYDKFYFDYKIYALERALVDRTLKTYSKTGNGNLGILLNGLKGTGKTVTSKIIANELKLPVILPKKNIEGIGSFINAIPQDIVIFVDEYEKIFGESTSLLSIMDGAFNSINRRVFLLTTNNLYVDDNLIQRPGRIRYLKKFENLNPSVVNEIVDDLLINKDLKNDCIEFVSNLETITVDIVKAIITEMNIHEEIPSVFQNVFNVKKIKGKYNVLLVEKDGTYSQLANNVNIYPRPNYSEDYTDYNFEIDGKRIGLISKVTGWTTFELESFTDSNGVNIGFDGAINIKITDADIMNYSFYHDEFGNRNFESNIKYNKKISDLAKNIIDSLEKSKSEDNSILKLEDSKILSAGIVMSPDSSGN